MKHVKYVLTMFIMLFFGSMVCHAKCSEAETNKLYALANQVYSYYEFIETIDYHFNISILNVTKNIYVVVGQKGKSKTIEYHYKDVSNGRIMFPSNNINEILTYTIDVYAEDSSCIKEKLYSNQLIIPRYNFLANSFYCTDIPDFYLCNKLTTENFDINYLKDRVVDYKEKASSSIKEEIVTHRNNIILLVFAIIFSTVLITLGTIQLIKYIKMRIDLKKHRLEV